MKRLGHEVLIGSGSIGTALRQAYGGDALQVELINLRAPQLVSDLHATYCRAGAQVLITNSFAAHPITLEESGMSDRAAEINLAAVELAKDAASDDSLIWGSVGPLSLGLGFDDYDRALLLDGYREQCNALSGADGLLLETFVDIREAEIALAAARETDLPVIFQLGNTGLGAGRWPRIAALVNAAVEAGAVAVGANCYHPSAIIDVVAYILSCTDLPVTASANAGHPSLQRGLVSYEFDPLAFGGLASQLIDMGVSVVGGCCGTGPEHIAQVAAVGKGIAVKPRSEQVSHAAAQGGTAVAAPVKNAVRELIESDRFLISVEIRAERKSSLNDIIAGTEQIAAAGVDMFDVPDNAGATVGRDGIVVAARLQQELSVPSIFHKSVTQSNLLQLHSSLLGGWDLGVQGALAVTGDSPSMGHLASFANRVTDLKSSVELIRLIKKLSDGKIVNDEPVADPPDYCIGCAISRAIPGQVKWLQKKRDAGAEFVFSQPVFDVDELKKMQDAIEPMGIRFLPGLLPLVSLGNARFLASGRIPGIKVPERLVEAMGRYDSREDQRKFGLETAYVMAEAMTESQSGIYMIMPFGKECYSDTAALVKHVRARSI